jgi:membrane protein implicated in regulation of membrane protease activity
LAGTVSTTKRNDIALIGIVLLACGIAALVAGASLTERLALTAGMWSAAVVAFATARRH